MSLSIPDLYVFPPTALCKWYSHLILFVRMDPDLNDDSFDELPFQNINRDTLLIQHSDEITHDGLGRKRTFERVHEEDNERKRLTFDQECFFYLSFFLRPYLMSLISLVQSRMLIWLAFGEFFPPPLLSLNYL